ncbi:MAG: ATP-binding cassette domain-containing protein, partial [Cocleimonas sp.]|nr:ATP-binding cassette domain-containing protein [Cocleimonas sp.]
MEGLNVNNISMVYQVPKGDPVEALKNVSFDIKAGEFLTILGPSGCGKTTLLDILAGFLEPTSGNASFNNQSINGPSPQRGMVFQQGALFEWMTVEQNVGFGP